MRVHLSRCAKAALIAATLAWNPSPVEAQTDSTSVARRASQRLQDDARGLRNGARAGSSAAVLGRERDRLRRDLDRLVRSHESWASELTPDESARLAATISEIEEGCARIRAHLDALDAALDAKALDRQRVQRLGQAIGRQAARCEDALRRARSAGRG
jgi:hypothetical protein